MSEVWNLFLFPFILTGLILLFTAVRRIDPLKADTGIDGTVTRVSCLYVWIVLSPTNIIAATRIIVASNTSTKS